MSKVGGFKMSPEERRALRIVAGMQGAVLFDAANELVDAWYLGVGSDWQHDYWQLLSDFFAQAKMMLDEVQDPDEKLVLKIEKVRK